MCLIIHKPAGREVGLEHVRASFSNNNDGFGIMYAHEGRVVMTRGLFALPQIEALVTEHMGREFVCHFRFATSGGVSVENAHPFKILDKDVDGTDLYMVHNGVIRNVDSTATESDTAVFVQKMLIPLFKTNPGLIHTPEFQKLLEEAIGGGNKLTFMDGDGKVVIINDDAGHRENEVWYSNKYSLTMSHRAGNGDSWAPDTFTGAYYPQLMEIVKDTPASRAGFRVNDIVVRVNDTEVKSFEQVMGLVAASNGRSCKFELYRPGKSKYVEISCRPQPRVDEKTQAKKFLLGVASKGVAFVPSKVTGRKDFNNPVFKSARQSAEVFASHLPATTAREIMAERAERAAREQAKVRNYPEYCYNADGSLNTVSASEYDALIDTVQVSKPIQLTLGVPETLPTDDEDGPTCPVLSSMERALAEAEHDIAGEEDEDEDQ